ncbi:uncharacterized protein LOC132029785 isoform X2 [Lycium ferocissimum]|uniref:uncharacterized protein LOC132029785 isoform X2 n=1 Tax=Lycium ferocissimum TaxID=112874 RepID=UPI002814984F|nr:uncharacterized protein LOC132029785 isoform X2 [Lycium ferocissimum]
MHTMSFCSSVSSPQSLSMFAKPFGYSKPYSPRISASSSSDVPDFLSSDWLEARREKPFGPRLSFSAEDAVRHQLDALKYNDQPHHDYGVEVMYRFERFRRIFHHSTYRVLLGHQEREILSSLHVNENLYKQRVWVRGTRPEEEEIFQFTLVQRVGGSWDGYWLTESVLHDGDTFSGGVAY